MIDIKYKSYDEMPINIYLKLRNVLATGDDDMNKEFEVISILSGIDIDTLMECKLEEIQGITNKCSFLSTSNINITDNIKEVEVNGIKYTVCDDLKKFTVAQYVDFQNYPKDEKHLAENLSTFVVPTGKKYGEGYDIVKTIGDFNEYMPISTAISLQNFFTKKLVLSTKDTLRSLIPLMKMQMKKMKKKDMEKIETKIKELEQQYGYLL